MSVIYNAWHLQEMGQIWSNLLCEQQQQQQQQSAGAEVHQQAGNDGKAMA
jgi:hypothetical protein